MGKIIKFCAEENEILIELNGSSTAEGIHQILPIKKEAQVWGNEIYFSIPYKKDLEDGKETLDIGSVAYWPPGNAFCIFFGETPESISEKPKAVSPVSVIGKIAKISDIENLKKVKQGQKIRLEPEQE